MAPASPRPLVLCKSSAAPSTVVVIDRTERYPYLERNADVRYARDGLSGLELVQELHRSGTCVDLVVLGSDPELVAPAVGFVRVRCALGDLFLASEVLVTSSSAWARALAESLCRWLPIEAVEVRDPYLSAAA